MDLLEHPLEAVAFRLYSLPDASAATSAAAAWTCLAAVLAAAAAAGIWRLRSSAPSSITTTTSATAKPPETNPCPAAKVPTAPFISPEPVAAASPAPSPKERYYTAYYREACRIGCCDDGEDDREDDAEERDGEDAGAAYRAPPETTATGPFGWEAEVVRSLPLSPTAAELGLTPRTYRRPTTPLGGSVVQLWEWDQVAGGRLTPTASPRRRGRGLATAPCF